MPKARPSLLPASPRRIEERQGYGYCSAKASHAFLRRHSWPRSAMSSKAALGHELGHAKHRGTKLPVGAWNDEFRASYWAAKNLANLSEHDRIHLVLDALERAREAGVHVSINAFMRRVLYGY